MLIRIPKGWEIPQREATPEGVYCNRRDILKAAGLLAASPIAALAAPANLYPAKVNNQYHLDVPVTEEWAATSYNNYYEFHPTDKQAVKDRVGKFVTEPWSVAIGGLAEKPGTWDMDKILNTFPLEERLYRFRCVERWAMAVPWTGFPLASLIKAVDPKSTAKFVRFETVNRPDQMPGMREAPYPYPYFEGLRMDEAMHPLTMVVTGLYGKKLPKQNGAPIRIIVPWKYGYKSIKSIVKIDLVAKQPGTFWNKINSSEYGFYSNINPKKPHPRWSQAIEQVIPNMDRRPTLIYNGYGDWVAGLYNGKED